MYDHKLIWTMNRLIQYYLMEIYQVENQLEMFSHVAQRSHFLICFGQESFQCNYIDPTKQKDGQCSQILSWARNVWDYGIWRWSTMGSFVWSEEILWKSSITFNSWLQVQWLIAIKAWNYSHRSKIRILE